MSEHSSIQANIKLEANLGESATAEDERAFARGLSAAVEDAFPQLRDAFVTLRPGRTVVEVSWHDAPGAPRGMERAKLEEGLESEIEDWISDQCSSDGWVKIMEAGR